MDEISASSPSSIEYATDLAARLLDHARVVLEVQPGRRPVGPQVLEREVGYAEVRDVARQITSSTAVGIAGRGARKVWSLRSVATG